MKRDRRWILAGAAASLPVVFAPIGDPDLGWHLSAASWMVENAAWLRSDVLPSTHSGLPWVNFEWLAQLIFYAANAAAGVTGMWLLKAALLSAAGVVVFRALSVFGAPFHARAVGLAWWAAAMIPRADLRTELFSLIAFGALLGVLETKERIRIPGYAGFLLFSLWANLHAGFLYGLFLLGAYSLEEIIEGKKSRLGKHLLICAAGTLVNPYGWKVYEVLGLHAVETGAVAPFISEWAAVDFGRPELWPLGLLAAALGCLFLRSARKSRAPLLPLIVSVVFGAAMVRHSRLSVYFAICAVVYGFRLLASDQALLRRFKPLHAVVFLASLGLFSLWAWGGHLSRGVYYAKYTPVRASAVLERGAEFSGLRLYNAWGWGGYLGYRLDGKLTLFQDGRYIFHPRLIEAGQAVHHPESWRDFLGRHEIDAALLQNTPVMMTTTRRYPDGSTKNFQRPYYAQYMPKERWALIYWDDKALLFLRRDVLHRKGVANREYRLARPYDEAALADALERGEVSRTDLAAERRRLRREAASLPVRPNFRPPARP